MTRNPIRCTLVGGAIVALAVAVPTVVAAAALQRSAAPDSAPVIVAQASTSVAGDAPAALPYPAYQRGVRRAAAEGPEALRRYIWRTRMIHHFYYYDFVSKE